MTPTAQEKVAMEWLGQTLLALGRDLFPRGYVRDVDVWFDHRGNMRAAWVMPPERLAKTLSADGKHHLPFRGPWVERTLKQHGMNAMLFYNENLLDPADFLQRIVSALYWPPELLDENGYAPDLRMTFIPEPGYPWPTDVYYSARKDRWIHPERPEWLLPERVVDEARHINEYGVDLCKLFDAEFGHEMDAPLARYGARPDELFMVTHAMGGTANLATDQQRIDQMAESVRRCGGLLFPSLAVGPVPATNFGPFILVADVGVVLNGLSPYKKRGRSLVHVYSSDAWTGRTADFLKDVAISAYEQLHGQSEYMYYMDLNLWQLGPDPDAPELRGPGVAERLTRVAQLKRELRERFRIWRRELEPPAIAEVREQVSTTKAHYGYLEAKVAGILPLREFPLAVAPRGYAEPFERFLDRTGFEGELLEVELPEEIERLMHAERVDSFDALNAALRAFFATSEAEAESLTGDFEKRQAIQTWADMQYGWHILDEVRAYAKRVVELR